jgi:aminoglycoside 6'-N-acetyltransferase I
MEQSDWAEWRRMRRALWPGATPEESEAEMADWATRPDTAAFVALKPDGVPCGFVEVGTRPYADGCLTSPVGYVEGWYVDPEARRQGYGRELIAAAEEWARAAGYQEIASDAELDNTPSQLAHERLGYAEVGRVVQFRKPLR